ncbi:hypothetical protein ACLOJK_008346 [Asimina triloba]
MIISTDSTQGSDGKPAQKIQKRKEIEAKTDISVVCKNLYKYDPSAPRLRLEGAPRPTIYSRLLSRLSFCLQSHSSSSTSHRRNRSQPSIMVEPTHKPNPTIKFLCSYGGKILPRYPDGKLRYVGGDTRVLSVDRSVTYQELMSKMVELCGSPSVSLRCQLPTEELDDALVSVTSDEDLANLIHEYDRAAPSVKIRAFLFSPKPKISPPSSYSSSSAATGRSSPPYRPVPASHACMMPVAVRREKSSKLSRCHACHTNGGNNVFLVHNGNHWQ